MRREQAVAVLELAKEMLLARAHGVGARRWGVRVIVDECVPRPLTRHLVRHEVTTAQERGWAGAENGALPRSMREAGAAVLVTTDRNLEHRQTVAATGLAVVVLVAPTNTLANLVPPVPALLDALGRAQPGRVTHVGV